MRKIWISLLTTALWGAGLPGVSMAGPLDQIKNLKIDADALKRPQRVSEAFQFSNFKLTRASGDMSEAWTVDLSHAQAIGGNVYVLRSLVLDGAGNVLFSGEDIVLPAARAAKTHTLTRAMPPRSGIASLTLQVFNQVENRVVVAQTFSLSAITGYGLQGAATARGTSTLPKPIESAPAPDSAIDHAITISERADGSVQIAIKNNNTFPLRLNEIMQRPDFAVGHASFESILRTCSAQQIPAKGEATCRFQRDLSCSTVKGIEFKLTLNGNTFFHDWKRDLAIRPIPHKAITITVKKETSFNTEYIQGPGIAEIRIRGGYLKPGEWVTMKGIMSVDSHDFPVVFLGIQSEDLLFGRVAVEGKRVEAPEKVCFRLTEITTYDDLSCGGAGMVLYRNDFGRSTSTKGAMDFFGQVHCK